MNPNIELDSSQLKDIPQIIVTRRTRTYLETGVLKIEIFNKVKNCQIDEVCPKTENWKYLSPKLPIRLDEEDIVWLEFTFAKDDPYVVSNLYKLEVDLTVLCDNRTYSATLNYVDNPSEISISITSLEFIDSQNNQIS